LVFCDLRFAGIIQSLTYSLSVSFVCLNFAIAYCYGIWLVGKKICSPYTVFQVIESLNTASMSLIAFATYFPEYVRARLSAALLFQMLNEKPRIDSLSPYGSKPRLEGTIRFSNLFFSYPVSRRHMVLKGLDIKIPAGKTVAFVGPSGCGKSTSIQLIERFYDPVVGKVLFDDEDARHINLQHLRSHISLVGQEPVLFNYSIRDNIAYGMENPSDAEIEAAAMLANAHGFITKLPAGYNTIVGEKGGMLSGGQKQRIAIARAVIRNPKILLLDEATSALDTESEKIVQEALERAREGRTCIVIAHRLSSIQNADLIVVLKDGKVVVG
ncbi:ABC transporter, ATP-binding protein, partial [Oesophagostomum dentatum]